LGRAFKEQRTFSWVSLEARREERRPWKNQATVLKPVIWIYPMENQVIPQCNPAIRLAQIARTPKSWEEADLPS
jgi:hypothetical protein